MESIQTSSVVESVVRSLRAAILAGDLAPGSDIRITELQDSLAVSHIPIREAIRQLEAEGLVVMRARRKPVVSGVDLADLDAVYDMRRLIELPLAARAQKGSTEESRRKVRESFEAYHEVADTPSQDAYWTRHAAFHWSLISGAATKWVERVLDPLWKSSERYVRLFVYTYAAPGETLELHRSLLTAFEESDPQAIVDELDRHFTLTVEGVKAGFARQVAAAPQPM